MLTEQLKEDFQHHSVNLLERWQWGTANIQLCHSKWLHLPEENEMNKKEEEKEK